MLRLMLVLGVVFSLAGKCGGGPTPPPPQPPAPQPLPIATLAYDLCRASVRGMSQFGTEISISKLTDRCGKDDTIPAVAYDQGAVVCEQNGAVHQQWVALLSNGGIELDQAKLKACQAAAAGVKSRKLSGLATDVVTALKDLVETGACKDVIKPLRNEAEKCTYTIECKDNLICRSVGTNPQDLQSTVCAQPDPTAKGKCRNDNDCGKNSFCGENFGTKLCEERAIVTDAFPNLDVGGDCSTFLGGLSCKPCLECIGDDSDPFGDGKCFATVSLNGDCSLAPCSRGLFCEDASKKCVASKTGGSCAGKNAFECAEGFYCGPPGDPNKSCKPWPTLGANCAEAKGLGANCDKGFCSSNDICVEGKIGENCASSHDCQPQFGLGDFSALACINSKCAKSLAVGAGPCTRNPEQNVCGRGSVCAQADGSALPDDKTPGVCVAQKGLGEECVNNPIMVQGCAQGVCKEIENPPGTKKNFCVAAPPDLPGLTSGPSRQTQFILLGS